MERSLFARRVLTVLALGVGADACVKPQPVPMDFAPRAFRSGDYDRVLDAWTRDFDLLLLQGADDRLRVTSTYLSWDYRMAHLAKYAETASLSATEREQTRANSQAAVESEHVFFVALQTSNTRWGLLDARTSAWHVRLIDDQGHEWQPTRIERYRRQQVQDLMDFPYITPWRQTFRVHFARQIVEGDHTIEALGAGTKWFILRFAGPLGTADLRWDVIQTDAGAP